MVRKDGDVTANPQVHEFKPDWCLAPAACLREWMEETHLSVHVLATTAVGWQRADEAAVLIQEVLDRKPLTERHVFVLERGTGISAGFWTRYEHNYRAGLAAGLKDCTDD
jgi:hypothetical protein